METYQVKPIHKPVNCIITVPGSKSMTNRALLMAALAKGTTQLKGVLFSEDSRHFLECLKVLGFSVDIEEIINSVTICGLGGKIPTTTGEIYVGSAGTAARFLTAMLALSDGTYRIQASKQMKARPMKPLFDGLTQMGAEFTYLEKEGFLPVEVRGTKNPAAEVSIDISKSTQFLSALLMMAPMLKQGLKIKITSEKKDGAYIRITRKMMEQFGCRVEFIDDIYKIEKNQSYHQGSYQIEPDVSAACYFYGAAALSGGKVTVRNVHNSSMQGDMKFLEVLQKLGCKVMDEAQGITVIGPADGKYPGIYVDMNDFSDQTMTLAALAVFATSKTHIVGIGHIRLQESDRLHAIAVELSKMGILTEEKEEEIIIFPGKPIPTQVDTYEDHRIAMSMALIGLKAEGIVINNPYCCRKTFENYFTVLEQLQEAVGNEITIEKR